MFEQMKGLTPKKKVEYFIQYYGLITLAIIAAVVFVGYWIVHVVTQKDSVEAILVINGSTPDDGSEMDEYLNQLLMDNGYDPKDTEISVTAGVYAGEIYGSQANYAGATKIQTEIAANTVSMVFFDENYVDGMLAYGALGTLEDYLSKDVLEAHKDDILYWEDEETKITYPVAIKVDRNSEFLQQAGWYQNDVDVYVGMCVVNSADVNISKQIILNALGD